MKNNPVRESLAIILVLFIVVFTFLFVLAAPCELFAHLASKDIPGRCLSTFEGRR